MVEKIESIIIGAGREHVILEKSTQAADSWRNHHGDHFTLITPNWSFRLPGAEYADA